MNSQRALRCCLRSHPHIDLQDVDSLFRAIPTQGMLSSNLSCHQAERQAAEPHQICHHGCLQSVLAHTLPRVQDEGSWTYTGTGFINSITLQLVALPPSPPGQHVTAAATTSTGIHGEITIKSSFCLELKVYDLLRETSMGV